MLTDLTDMVNLLHIDLEQPGCDHVAGAHQKLTLFSASAVTLISWQ
jgi:hypothetical protein